MNSLCGVVKDSALDVGSFVMNTVVVDYHHAKEFWFHVGRLVTSHHFTDH